MQTRILHTEIWQDDFFVNLNSNEKLLFIYFLTNDSVNIIHLYRCNIQRITADTGIDKGIILKAQEKFEKNKKMFFKDGFVFLKNASRYEKYEGSKNEVAKVKLFSKLSKDILDWYNNISDTPIDSPIDRVYKSKTINHKLEIINNKSENINQKPSEEFMEELRNKLKMDITNS